MFMRRRKLFRRFLNGIAKIVCLALFFIFGIIPLTFKYSYTFQRSMLFLPFVRWPRNVDFDKPEKLGLHGARNFYVTSSKGIRLGAWHILPQSMVKESESTSIPKEEFFEQALSRGQPVVLYMHGNSGSRAGLHRVELYHVLQKLDYHIIAFDYRSYGDSSSVAPSENGVVDDGVCMYNWTKQRTGKAPLFVWGHSLGTGISAHVLAQLTRLQMDVRSEDGQQMYIPKALVLESPFNNLRDEIQDHPLAQEHPNLCLILYTLMPKSEDGQQILPKALVLECPFNNIRDQIQELPLFKFFTWMPWFSAFFLDPVKQNGLVFETDVHVKSIPIPIIILHAEDDAVVPYKLGRKLYHTAVLSRSPADPPVMFAKFDGSHGFGHKYICRSPELPSIVSKFFSDSLKLGNASEGSTPFNHQ
ncbi:lysophosphatidylserine lipase ABHD12 isoform X2 [Ischnura elegans]|uniref:lysophosphatidylserine lipase ABHD12 isoform X2 n=1 Tax=Ischnura elegans TaxID=197161 RepID=UPI001ED878D8|nr:lysophosphatidylserine lipase ABHD12 isoform X2 [Ischnura elegans]